MASDIGPDPEPIGARIKRLRQEKKLAQDRLAIQANVDQSGLSKLERGRQRNFGAESIARIAKALGLGFEELVAGTDWEQVRAKRDLKE